MLLANPITEYLKQLYLLYFKYLLHFRYNINFSKIVYIFPWQLLGVQDFIFCLKILRSAAVFNSLGNPFRIRAPAARTDFKPNLVIIFLLVTVMIPEVKIVEIILS